AVAVDRETGHERFRLEREGSRAATACWALRDRTPGAPHVSPPSRPGRARIHSAAHEPIELDESLLLPGSLLDDLRELLRSPHNVAPPSQLPSEANHRSDIRSGATLELSQVFVRHSRPRAP